MFLIFIETIILSVVQGITEFLPVSSSAHLIIFSKLGNFQADSLTIDIGAHLGSLIAILIFFRKDLLKFSQNKSISRYSPIIDQKETLFNLSQKKPIVPSDLEIKENPPSRSAKLRYAIKKSDFFNFDTDIEKKFKNFLEIKKFGDKL